MAPLQQADVSEASCFRTPPAGVALGTAQADPGVDEEHPIEEQAGDLYLNE